MHETLIIAGDDIGREVIPAAERCLHAALPSVRTYYGEAGYGLWQRTGNSVTPQAVERLRSTGAALMGPERPPRLGVLGAIPILTTALDLFAALYPLYPVAGGTPLLLAVQHDPNARHEPTPHLAPDEAWQVTRLGNLVTTLRERGRERVAVVNDSEDEFVRAVVGGIGQGEDVEPLDALLVVNQFELVAPTLDIMVASAPTARLLLNGLDSNRYLPAERARLLVGAGGVIAQPAHGPLPEQIEWGFTNPLGAIYAVVALLRFAWQEEERASALEAAVAQGLRRRRTPDRGGLHSMNEVVNAIIAELASE